MADKVVTDLVELLKSNIDPSSDWFLIRDASDSYDKRVHLGSTVKEDTESDGGTIPQSSDLGGAARKDLAATGGTVFENDASASGQILEKDDNGRANGVTPGSATWVDWDEIPSNIWSILKSSAYTVATNDRGKMVTVTGATTITLQEGANYSNGFCTYVKNVDYGSGNSVTVAVSGADAIDGGTSITLAEGDAVLIVRRNDDNTKWETI